MDYFTGKKLLPMLDLLWGLKACAFLSNSLMLMAERNQLLNVNAFTPIAA